MEANLTDAVGRIIGRHAVVGLAVGLVRRGSVEFASHGVADIAGAEPVTPQTGFRIASITKTFTAVAVMQLAEQGLVDLDAPANEYLRSLQLRVHPGLGQPSVRHLLTHTAGLGELARPWGFLLPDFGESVPSGEHLPTLAHFYKGGPRVHAPPGSRFVYGNHSPAVLGQLVEDVTGLPLPLVYRERIFDPLGMDHSDALRSERVQHLATGYEIGSRGAQPVPERDMVTTGAASIFSTPADMALYLQALLDGGGPLLQPGTMAQMFAPQYQPDPRIPGMGLGFFRTRLGGYDVVGHQGTHPGFHSQVFVVPAAGTAVMVFTNGGHRPDFWVPGAALGLLEEVLEIPGRKPAVPQPAVWGELCGWYALDAGWADTRLRGLMGAGVEVVVRAGRPLMRFLTPIPALARGLPLEPDEAQDPLVFRLDFGEPDMRPMRVVFGRDDDGLVDRLHLDLMPVTLHRRPEASNPRRWATGGVAAGVLLAAGARLRRR
jgi:CubicO group peptidase (beta-lactamase class C family)